MVAAQAGNAGPYHRLLTEAGAWLRRYFARRLPPAMVDDAVQDTLLAVHQKRHTYDPARPFEPWLAAIARYKWIDRLRAMKAAPAESLTEDIAVQDHGEAVTRRAFARDVAGRAQTRSVGGDPAGPATGFDHRGSIRANGAVRLLGEGKHTSWPRTPRVLGEETTGWRLSNWWTSLPRV